MEMAIRQARIRIPCCSRDGEVHVYIEAKVRLRLRWLGISRFIYIEGFFRFVCGQSVC